SLFGTSALNEWVDCSLDWKRISAQFASRAASRAACRESREVKAKPNKADDDGRNVKRAKDPRYPPKPTGEHGERFVNGQPLFGFGAHNSSIVPKEGEPKKDPPGVDPLGTHHI
ncbi:hypothetical protein THAOC_24324, partial [Thalassiosira oceanica]